MEKRPEFEAASFLTSAARVSQCPPDEGLEIAFCGRSNAGKSSTLNYLTKSKGLARTSKTPGRTQLINFFDLPSGLRLVDLPGFGYAKVPQKLKDAWHRSIDEYLRSRDSLFGLVAVMDIRHPLKDFDQMMIDWGVESGLNVHVVLTKCDKLKAGPRKAAVQKVSRALPDVVSVQALSSTHDIGRGELVATLSAWVAAVIDASAPHATEQESADDSAP